MWDLIFLHTNLNLNCFSRMQIPDIHESIIVMTRYTLFQECFWSTCFIGSKTTRLLPVVLNPIRHSCSFFKHYLTEFFWYDRHDKYNDMETRLYEGNGTRIHENDKAREEDANPVFFFSLTMQLDVVTRLLRVRGIVIRRFPFCCSTKQAVIPILSELISTTHFFFHCAEFVQIIYKYF